MITFRYLWEQFGSQFWVIDHFRCVIKQLIYQEWSLGIDMLFQSEVTQQMVKGLTSRHRSNFIEDFIGNPFD